MRVLQTKWIDSLITCSCSRARGNCLDVIICVGWIWRSRKWKSILVCIWNFVAYTHCQNSHHKRSADIWVPLLKVQNNQKKTFVAFHDSNIKGFILMFQIPFHEINRFNCLGMRPSIPIILLHNFSSGNSIEITINILTILQTFS